MEQPRRWRAAGKYRDPAAHQGNIRVPLGTWTALRASGPPGRHGQGVQIKLTQTLRNLVRRGRLSPIIA